MYSMENAQPGGMPARLPRYQRVPNYPPVKITPPRLRILEAIAQFDYLSAPQLARLLLRSTSLTYVEQDLKELFHGKWVRRVFLPRSEPGGSPLAIYSLDNDAVALLRRQGNGPVGRFHAGEQAERERLFLKHTLEANDLLILAKQVERRQLGVTIAKLRPERELKRARIYVDVAHTKLPVVPDGWVDFRYDGRQICVAFELDRGTEDRRVFQRKIEGLVRYADGPYQAAFDTESITVAFVTTAAGARLREMLGWTERTLNELHLQQWHDLFWFAAFDPARADPVDVFLAPWWVRPFHPERRALLEEAPEEA